MNVLSIPPLVMAGIAVYAGFHHLLVYSQQRDHRADLTFGLTCFAMAAYDTFCAGLYSASSVAEGMQWQRAQGVTLAIICATFLWFVADYTGLASGKALRVFSAYFLLAALMGAVAPNGLAWRVDQPDVKNFVMFGLEITHYEVKPGPLTDVQSVVGMLSMGYALWLSLRHLRRQRKKAVPLVVSMGFVVAGALNDTLMSSGVYSLIYTIEYAYMAVVFLMAYSLAREMEEATLALREREAQNRALLNTIPDLIFRFDSQGTCLEIFTAAESLLVAPPQEMLGRKLSDLLPPLVARERMRCIEQALQTGQVQVHEYQLVQRGVANDYEARIVACGQDQVMTLVRDITERRQAEKEKSYLAERAQQHHSALIRLATHPALTEGQLEQALQVIAETAAETMEVERVNIWRHSSDGRQVRCVETFEYFGAERVRDRVIAIDHYPRYFAALEANPALVVSDVVNDPRASELTVAYWRPLGIGATIDVPVRLHGQLVGMVCHEHVGGGRQWLPDEIAFAERVADLVALVFLHADVHRRAEELAAITRVSREITSAPDLQQVLHSIARHAAELSRSDASGVCAFRADGRLYIESSYGVSKEFIELINAQGIAVGEGAIGQAMARGSSFQISDVWKESKYAFPQIAQVENVRAILAVPMLRDERTVGGIVLWHRQPRYFEADQVSFLNALAQQCANAIENARLVEESQRWAKELTGLYHTGLAITSVLDTEALLRRVYEQVDQLLAPDVFAVALYRAESSEICFVLVMEQGQASMVMGRRLLLEEGGLTGWVMRMRQPLLVGDLQADKLPIEPNYLSPCLARAWLGVPLIVHDRLLGAMSVQSFKPFAFDAAHCQLVELLASLVAIALENARLFDQEAQRIALLTQALEQQQELDRLKDQFIQNVSHELRTPLSIARGYAELLDSGDLGELQPEQREPIAVITRRMRMLSKLMDDINAILEVEVQAPRREMVFLADIVQALLADFGAAAKKAGLDLIVDVAPNLSPVTGDPIHLRRVLDNLLSNALKFTPAGGHVAVRLDRENGGLVLEVADTGIGIPGDKLDRIFERFYQIDGGTNRRFGGVGLGLSLVKEIIQAHGGTISVESQPGEGSTFRVRLPAAKGQKAIAA